MNPRLLFFLIVAGSGAAVAADPKPAAAPVVAAPAAAAPRADADVAPSASFDVFRGVGDRNIFNSYRTGRRERSEEPIPVADTISFVGTMDSDKGVVAFFDSSINTYRKVLHVGESVADFKLTKIAPDRVELAHGGSTILMRLAQQLRRPPGGTDWSVGDMQIVAPDASAIAADPNAPPVISASDDPVVKRMKERRQKELTK